MILAIAVGVSAFTLFGAWHARRTRQSEALTALYVTFAALSQVLAAKIATFDFGFYQFTAPAAVMIFAVTFLLTDIVNEKFGKRQVYRMIGITFVTQIALVTFLWIGNTLPAAPFWPHDEAWRNLLGLVPRITFASWATFLVSESLDAWLFAHVRRLTGGRHLWLRNVMSTIPALTVDTVMFVTLAFWGSGIPLWPIMLGQFATKYVVGIIDIPFMYANRAILGPRLVDN